MGFLHKLFKSPWLIGAWTVLGIIVESLAYIGVPSVENEHARVLYLLYVFGVFIFLASASFIALQRENTRLQAGPQFSGHFYQFRILTPSPADVLLGPTAYVGDWHVFVESYIVNTVEHSGNVVDFDFKLEMGGEMRRLERLPSFDGWAMSDGSLIKDLGILMGSHAFERGHGMEGWLHFVVRNVPGTEMMQGKARDCALCITDGLTEEHTVKESLTDLSVQNRPAVTWATPPVRIEQWPPS
jgi:hypothetical protein